MLNDVIALNQFNSYERLLRPLKSVLGANEHDRRE